MKNDENLIDSLLKEHARMKKEGIHDQKFLDELEQKIDAERDASSTETTAVGQSSGWGIGKKLTALAACVAIGGVAVVGYQQYMVKDSGDIVLENKAVNAQINEKNDALNLPSSLASEDIARPSSAMLSDESLAMNSPSQSSRRVSGKKEAMSDRSDKIGDYGDGWVRDKSPGLAKSRSKIGSKRQMMPQDEIPQFGGATGHDVTPNSERYGDLVENAFVAPVDKETKRSTFAIDVDTASYANVRNLINLGQPIPKDAVRIEEMVNYFDYQYAEPNDEHPFAIHTAVADCPWKEGNKLVRIALKGKDLLREERPASNIVFLLDVSGSMNADNKLPILKDSLKYLLEELNADDSVSIVVYAGASGVALPATAVDDQGRTKIMNALEKLSAGGSTAGGQGVKVAYKLAKENFVKGGINRVILATDGDFNVGISDTDALTEMIKNEAKDGVYLSVLGFGRDNINDQMLESITNSGNGNYSYIDSIKEGRKVLLEDMMGTMVTIAKDVKIQVEFNPLKVKEYRLIGYSNRMLQNSAFLDKKADAGEIGAGHSVTAFYEIVPGKAVDMAKMDELRYKKNSPEKPEAELEMLTENADELLHVKLAYKRPDQKMLDESTYFSQAVGEKSMAWGDVDDDFKFASSVALFGMVTRASDYKGEGDLDMVTQLAEAGKGSDGKGYRAEFIKLIKKLKESE